jgi:AMP phosphorylase
MDSDKGEKLRVGIIDIDAGRPIVLLHPIDAKRMSIHMGDRAQICKKGSNCTEVAIVDISDTMVPEGEIGIFNDLAAPMRLSPRSSVYVSPRPKPESVSFIRKKIDGKDLSDIEITTIVKDIVHDRLSDIELTSFVTASAIHGYSKRETIFLTKAMVDTGDRLDFKGVVVDKHCIGGVPGNRTTMMIVPMLASMGIKIPKTSSRAITSPAGTADTMEVLCPVSYGATDVKRFVNKVGACIVWGGAINLAPADDKIIRVEYPLSIDAEGQVLASIISKKKSVGSDYVLIDIPYGPGSKILGLEKAKELCEKFVWLGNEVGMKVKYILTDGTKPIGNGIGPVLEARDILLALGANGPPDLVEKSIMMVSEIMEFSGNSTKGQGVKEARQSIEDGSALAKMKEIIKIQGGNPSVKISDLKTGRFKYEVKAVSGGKISSIDNSTIAMLARTAGAPQDPAAGIFIATNVGDKISTGETMFTIYSQNKTKLAYSQRILKRNNPITIT